MTVIHALTGELAGADDQRIARVVALIDAMQARGDADALIAPLRLRLQQLRPARPPRLGRLLFQPLDAVIVPTERWRPEALAIPRSALLPLLGCVRDGLGGRAAAIETAVATCAPDEGVRLAPTLWAAAAPVLRGLADTPPPGWIQAGLPRESFAPISRAVGGILAHAEALRRLVGPDPVKKEAILDLFDAVAAEPGESRGLLVALLLLRAPDPQWMLRSLRDIAGWRPSGMGGITERAVDSLVEQARAEAESGTRLPLLDLPAAVAEARHAAGLVRALAEQAGPRRQRSVEAFRRAMDTACRLRLETGITDELLRPLHQIDGAAPAAEIISLEDRARDLRRLDAEARRISGQEAGELLLQQAAGSVVAARRLQGADLVRMVEILAGPEQALALLDG